MDFPAIGSSQPIKQNTGQAPDAAAFTDAMALKGGAGAVGPIPLPTRDFERRVADRIFMQCFGDWEDIGADAGHRTFELPSIHIHLDAAIAGVAIRFRDELARMREQHSLQELRDIARAGARVALEALDRGDNIGFSEQFEANVFAGMNKKSREILNDRRIAASGNFVGPERLFPEWNPDGRPGMPQGDGLGGGSGGGFGGGSPGVRIDPMPDMPGGFMQNGGMQNGGSEGPGPDFDEIGRRMDELQRRGIPTPDGEGTWPGGISPAEMLRNATTQGHNHALEQMEEAAREAIERSLGNSPFVTGSDPIAEAIEEHGPLIELFLHALRAQYTPGVLGGAPSSRPGISTATINALRNLDPKAAADLVNEQLADTIENVPPNYRDAILEALGNGDEQDPDIERAITRLEQLRKAEGPDAVDGPPVVTTLEQAITVLYERYGIRVTDDLSMRASNRPYHSLATFLEVVNDAMPILDTVGKEALRGLSLALRHPNNADALQTRSLTLGVSHEGNGTFALLSRSQIAAFETLQDAWDLFRSTLLHELTHSMVSKAPEEAERFRENEELVATVLGPNSRNAQPGALSREEAIDEFFFLGSWRETVEYLRENGYSLVIPVKERIDYFERNGSEPNFSASWAGTVNIYREADEEAADVLGEILSNYAGENEYEALAEFGAAYFQGNEGALNPDGSLPFNTMGFIGEMPRNLGHHFREFLEQVRSQPGPVNPATRMQVLEPLEDGE